MVIRSGEATDGRGGLIVLSVGSGTSSVGGSFQAFAGCSAVHTGGALSLASGEGTTTSSGMITIRSINAGEDGASGMLVFSFSSCAEEFLACLGGYWCNFTGSTLRRAAAMSREGTPTTSGEMKIRSTNGSVAGASGALYFSTDTSNTVRATVVPYTWARAHNEGGQQW